MKNSKRESSEQEPRETFAARPDLPITPLVKKLYPDGPEELWLEATLAFMDYTAAIMRIYDRLAAEGKLQSELEKFDAATGSKQDDKPDHSS